MKAQKQDNASKFDHPMAIQHFSSSSSIATEHPDQFGGSNDFILTGKKKQKFFKTWIEKKMKKTCSKKMLKKRVPVLSWLPKYDKTCFVSDIIAGITVALTVIPQSLAYASIAGVPPQYGLYSSFLGCFIYIIFGSCKDATIGPTAIVAMLVGEAIKDKGPEYAILLCFLSGVVQFLMGFLGLGFLIDFISGPVSSGFVSSAAVIIVTSQIKNLLGIKVPGHSFIKTWEGIITNIGNTSVGDAILGSCCVVSLMLLKSLGELKFEPKNKFRLFLKTIVWVVSIGRNAILVLVCGLISYFMSQKGKPPFTVTGHVPSGFPDVRLPPFSYTEVINGTVYHEDFFDMLNNLGSGIVLISLIGIVEGISVCKTFANGKPVDATQEFIAIGLCNIGNSFVQAFPGSAALARSAVNNSSGVKTTLGGLYTGTIVIIGLLFLTPYFSYIPKATLAAIIIVASFFMIEIKVVKPIWKAKKSDLIPGLAAFLSCLLLPVQYGLIIGVGTNFVFIMYHAARPKISIEKLKSNDGVYYLLLTPDRCLIFPSVNYVRNLVTKYSLQQEIPVVIDCSHIYGADYTAATVIKSLTQDFAFRQQPLFFYNLKPSVSSMIDELSPQDFVVFYNREEFDEMLNRWGTKRPSSGVERY